MRIESFRLPEVLAIKGVMACRLASDVPFFVDGHLRPAEF